MLVSVARSVSAEDVGQLNCPDHGRPRLRGHVSIHGTDNVCKVLMSNVQIDRSAFRCRMPEQALNVVQVGTRLQEMSREAMTERMYERGFINPGLREGPLKNLLYGACMDGCVRFLPREEPGLRSEILPILSQSRQGSLRQQRIPIAPSLPLLHPNGHSMAVDVLDTSKCAPSCTRSPPE